MGSDRKAALHEPAVPRSHLEFPLFDSLRGFAALSVLVFHVAGFAVLFGGSIPWPVEGLAAHLNVGVTFFFVLSAFLLYRPFVAARVSGRDRPAFSGYAKRRFLRIAPAYWAALTVTAIVPGMSGAFSGNWWVYYGLLQELPIYTRVGTCAEISYRCGIPPTWTLAVEVMFYALLPVFVLILARIGRSRRTRSWLVPELAAISVLALVSLPIQSQLPVSGLMHAINYSPFGMGLWFALGLGVASVSVWAEDRISEPEWVGLIRTRPWIPLGIGAGLYVALSLFVLESNPLANVAFRNVNLYMVEFVAFGVIALLVVLPAVFGRQGEGRYRWILRHPLSTWLGLISYGIFLWHFPAIILLIDIGAPDWWPQMSFAVLLAGTLAITIPCAAVSYYAIERPIMRWSRRSSIQRPDEGVSPTLEPVTTRAPATPERDPLLKDQSDPGPP